MDCLFRGIEFKVQSPQFEKARKDGKRIIRGYASTDDLDRQNEIISREALEGAKTDLLANVTVFMEHQHSMLPIGKVTDCILDANGLLIEVSLSNATFVDDIWTLIEEGILNSFSIGGVVLDGHDERNDNGQSYHVIDKISILEVSVVGLPANPAAKFEPVYKSFYSAIAEQIKQKEGSINMAEQDKKEVVETEESQEEVANVEVEKEEEVKEEVVEEKKEEVVVEEEVEKPEIKVDISSVAEGEKVEAIVIESKDVVEPENKEEEEVKVEEKVVDEKEEEKEVVADENVEEVESETVVEDEVVEKSDETSPETLEKENEEAEEEEAPAEKSTDEKILDALALIIEKLSAMDKKEIEEKKEVPEAEKTEEDVDSEKAEVVTEVEEKEVVEVKAVEKVEVEKKEEEEPKRKSIAVVVPSPYEETEKNPEEVSKTTDKGWNKLFFGK